MYRQWEHAASQLILHTFTDQSSVFKILGSLFKGAFKEELQNANSDLLCEPDNKRQRVDPESSVQPVEQEEKEDLEDLDDDNFDDVDVSAFDDGLLSDAQASEKTKKPFFILKDALDDARLVCSLLWPFQFDQGIVGRACEVKSLAAAPRILKALMRGKHFKAIAEQTEAINKQFQDFSKWHNENSKTREKFREVCANAEKGLEISAVAESDATPDFRQISVAITNWTKTFTDKEMKVVASVDALLLSQQEKFYDRRILGNLVDTYAVRKSDYWKFLADIPPNGIPWGGFTIALGGPSGSWNIYIYKYK